MILTTRTFLRAVVPRACVRVGGAVKSLGRGGKSRRRARSPVVVVPLSGEVVSRRPALHLSLARGSGGGCAVDCQWPPRGSECNHAGNVWQICTRIGDNQTLSGSELIQTAASGFGLQILWNFLRLRSE